MTEQTQETTQAEQSEKSSLLDQLPLDNLTTQVGDYVTALGEKAINGFSGKVDGLIDKLNGVSSTDEDGEEGAMGKAAKKGAEKLAEGDSPVKAGLSGAMSGVTEKVKQTFGGGGGGGGGGKQKFSNIVETIEVGVPITVAYNQWTQFQDWTGFMKKLEHSEEQTDEKLSFKGQIFLSHRSWESTVIQQVPDEQIVWKSTGQKGYLDGGVTFHEIGPRLTRIVVVIEYHPQGFVEKTGNIWRAAGRRIRVELKRYVNHVMTETILDPDSAEGWRGEIRDREVVRTHEEAVEAEQAQQEDEQAQQEDEQAQQEADQPQQEAEATQEDYAQTEPEDDSQIVSGDDEEPAEDQSPDEEAPVEDETPPQDYSTDQEEAPAEFAQQDSEQPPADNGEVQSDDTIEPAAEPQVNDEAPAEQEAPASQDEQR